MTTYCISLGQIYSCLCRFIDDGNITVLPNIYKGETKLSSLLNSNKEDVSIDTFSEQEYIKIDPAKRVCYAFDGQNNDEFINLNENTEYTLLDIYSLIIRKMISIAGDKYNFEKNVVIKIPSYILNKSIVSEEKGIGFEDTYSYIQNSVFTCCQTEFRKSGFPLNCIVYDLSDENHDVSSILSSNDDIDYFVINIMNSMDNLNLGGNYWNDVIYNRTIQQLSNETGYDAFEFEDDIRKK